MPARKVLAASTRQKSHIHNFSEFIFFLSLLTKRNLPTARDRVCSDSFAFACNLAQSAPSVSIFFVNPGSKNSFLLIFSLNQWTFVQDWKLLDLQNCKVWSEREKCATGRSLQYYEYHVTTVLKPFIVLKDIISFEFYPSALAWICFYSQRFRSWCKSANAIQYSNGTAKIF